MENDQKFIKDLDIVKNVKIDLKELIKDIYISPVAAEWFVDTVRKICKKYGIEANIIQSSLKVDKSSFI